jgi:uncharacterized protein with HEPN domain
MRLESRKLLWDARKAAGLARTFVHRRTLEDYLSDVLLRSGVERQLEIMGEALAQLRQRDAETAELVPSVRDIIGFRNILAHGYAGLDDMVVWRVVSTNLDALISTLSNLLGDE